MFPATLCMQNTTNFADFLCLIRLPVQDHPLLKGLVSDDQKPNFKSLILKESILFKLVKTNCRYSFITSAGLKEDQSTTSSSG